MQTKKRAYYVSASEDKLNLMNNIALAKISSIRAFLPQAPLTDISFFKALRCIYVLI